MTQTWLLVPEDDREPSLRGRSTEREALDRLLERVRSGESATLVLHGEPGVGKTALLQHAIREASDVRIAEVSGVESEAELPYAALHSLCAAMVGHLDGLPEPQHDALRLAFGLASGPAPDRFLVALAALSLMAEAAAERPLVCLVDDAQWLDDASGQVLGFVARRLSAESVFLAFAVREVTAESHFAGLPELRLEGLGAEDARSLLAAALPRRLDDQVRDRIVAETRGNPRALLELPRCMSAAELAGGFARPGPGSPSGPVDGDDVYGMAALPDATRRLMLVAAAEPTGNATLLWRAAHALGIERDAAAAEETEHVLEIGASVRFRDPSMRAAVYRTAPPEDRRAVHRALAAATDPHVDPDRRAWHLAAAAAGPDEAVATELERWAGRAAARGGLAAEAAFLERSVALTRAPARYGDRALNAAHANLNAGEFVVALGLLAAGAAGPQDALQRARADRLRGQIASVSGAGREAPAQLLEAAQQLAPLDVSLARATYLDAWGASLFAGARAGAGNLLAISRAAMSVPQPTGAPHASDLLLDGLALLITEGRVAAGPTLRRAVTAFNDEDLSGENGLQWGALASTAAVSLWDFESWDAVITRQVELARGAGALAPLSIGLHGQGIVVAWRGDFEAAAAVAAEADSVTAVTGTRPAPYGALLLAALRGYETEARALIDATINSGPAGGEGLAVQYAQWAAAILANGLGHCEEARDAAQHASDGPPELFLSAWALPELIEASVRSGDVRLARAAFVQLTASANESDSDWGLGIVARGRALLSEGAEAEDAYREAISRLSRTPLRTEVARAHLLYGEWLRRQNRRVDAREQLRTAHDMLTSIGMQAFAERARRELLATGDKVRRRSDDTRCELTPQEERIAWLAGEGRTNPEIGAELYLSPRTVEWHLRKVFTKLGISSRKGLVDALPARTRQPALV